jgi:hypothetical protein
MEHDKAENLAMGYAWGREDASGTATAGDSQNPFRTGYLAFAEAYAQGYDDFNNGRRCSMNNVRAAYEHWQASGGRSVFARGDLTLSEAGRDELHKMWHEAWGWGGSKDTSAYYARQAELQDAAWNATAASEEAAS